MSKKLVYIAGPLTTGNQDRNVHRAVQAADMVYAMGGIPLIPHLSTVWAMISGKDRSYEEWLDIDFEYIRRCDALYRTPGASAGADREVEFANEIGIPVFDWISEGAMHEFLGQMGARRLA
jgi:hypothetical protein